MEEARITSLDFGILEAENLANPGNCRDSDCVALAYRKSYTFAKPIGGVTKITFLDFAVLASRILEILEIAEIVILGPWLLKVLYILLDPLWERPKSHPWTLVFWTPKSWKPLKLPKF